MADLRYLVIVEWGIIIIIIMGYRISYRNYILGHIYIYKYVYIYNDGMFQICCHKSGYILFGGSSFSVSGL